MSRMAMLPLTQPGKASRRAQGALRGPAWRQRMRSVELIPNLSTVHALAMVVVVCVVGVVVVARGGPPLFGWR
jgi:hypothetical protein